MNNRKFRILILIVCTISVAVDVFKLKQGTFTDVDSILMACSIMGFVVTFYTTYLIKNDN